MMAQIHVTYDPAQIDTAGVLNRLQMRHLGRAGRAKIVLAPFASYFGVFLIAQYGFGVPMLGDTGLWAIWAFYAAVAAFVLARFHTHRRLRMDVDKARYKAPISTFKLDAKGVESLATNFTWDQVQSVERLPSVTALKLTPQLYTLLPDTGLPDGMTAETLLTQIETWRA